MSNLPSRSFVFVGGDDLQRQKNIQALIKKRFGAEEYEFHRYHAAQGQIPSAVEEVLSFSLFSPNKVVQVNHMEKASARNWHRLFTFEIPGVMLCSSFAIWRIKGTQRCKSIA